MSDQSNLIGLSADGVKLSYRRFLTDVAVGLLVILILVRHWTACSAIDIKSTPVAIACFVIAAPLGIVISAFSMLVLSLPLFVAELLIAWLARSCSLVAFVVTPAAERGHSFSASLRRFVPKMVEYFRVTAAASKALAVGNFALYSVYHHYEGVAIFSRNVTWVSFLYSYAGEVGMIAPVCSLKTHWAITTLLFLTTVQLVLYSQSFLLMHSGQHAEQ